jgi:cytochrome b561
MNHQRWNNYWAATVTTKAKAPSVFTRLRRNLHWLVTALILMQIPLAWFMIEQRLGPDKLSNYALHKSLGIVLLTIGLVRIAVIIGSRRPALPAAMPRVQRVLARCTEGILLLLLIVMPMSGWLMSAAANFPVSVFGWFTLPNLVSADKDLFEALQKAHRYQSYVLLTLVGLHVAAALRHYFILRDNVLYAMLPLKRFNRK